MANKNPMKHVWMVEDVPASGAREAKSFWTKIGVAVENRDGSLSLTLAAIPVSGVRARVRVQHHAQGRWQRRAR